MKSKKPTKHGPKNPSTAKPDDKSKPKKSRKGKDDGKSKPKPKDKKVRTLRSLAEENPVRFQETFERAMYFTRQRMGRPFVSGNSPADFVAEALIKVIDVPIRHSALSLMCMVAARIVYKRKRRDRLVTNFNFTESPYAHGCEAP